MMEKMCETKFSFEDLDVWQKSIDFAVSVIGIADTMNSDRNHYRLIEQLESSPTSISANIAEGKWRNSIKKTITK
ncbi:MAG: four helix bundle protein [Candidatus Scalindua sp.]|nr:four helix bundle protein [Candidatus Scalindua sp.]